MPVKFDDVPVGARLSSVAIFLPYPVAKPGGESARLAEFAPAEVRELLRRAPSTRRCSAR